MRSIANAPGLGALNTQAAHGGDAQSMPAGIANALTSGRASEIFAYTPNSMVVAVGQKVELRPPRNESCRLFAVAPELPRGIEIDKTTGLITGTAQEATDGIGSYFVTSCEPSMVAADIKIEIAMVHINVIKVVAPGYTVKNVCREATGEMTLTLHDDVSNSAATSCVGPSQSTESSELFTQQQLALISGMQEQLVQEQTLQNAANLGHPSSQLWAQQGQQPWQNFLQFANMQQGYGPLPQVEAFAQLQANMQFGSQPRENVSQQVLAAQIEAQLMQAVTVIRGMGGNQLPDQSANQGSYTGKWPQQVDGW